MYANNKVSELIKSEIKQLERQKIELSEICKQQNLDINLIAGYSQINDRVSRLNKALDQLVNERQQKG